MTIANKPRRELLVEIEGLRFRLEEVEKSLRAMGGGKVDALVVSGQAGGQDSSLQGAEQSCRVLVEKMNEGAPQQKRNEEYIQDISTCQQQEEYMASETLARSIIRQAGDAIVVCDCEGRIILASRLARQICGEDPMLTPFDELFRLRIVKPQAMFSVLHSLRGGDFENVEVEFTRRDATIFSLLLSASQLKNVQGRTIGFLVTLTDITGRRQAEGALRESDLKYRTLFNNTLNGLVYGQVLLDAQGHPADCRFLDVNDTFVDLTGLEKEALLERTAREIMPGTDKSPVDFIGVHGKVALSGEETRFEQYSENLKRWYSVFVFSPEKGYFISIFNLISINLPQWA